MKRNAQGDDALDETLRMWRIAPKADVHFRPAVWERLRSRSAVSWSQYLRHHAVRWSAATLVLALTAGWAGRAVGQASLESKRDAMIVTYLVDLDPRVQAKLRH